MDLGLLSPSLLVVLSSVLTLVGYVLFDALDNGTLRQQSKRTSRYLIFMSYNCNEFLRMKTKTKNIKCGIVVEDHLTTSTGRTFLRVAGDGWWVMGDG